jgi:hypothetical protein
VAAGTDWPGLDHWARTEGDALARLGTYLSRYAGVAERAGLAGELTGLHGIQVVDRVPRR